jgi:fatty acid desaturase
MVVFDMASELKSLFTQKELEPFTRHNNFINVLCLLILYGLSFAIIFFYRDFQNPLYILTGFMIMGAVQHTLATLVHEAAHFNLFSHRKLNDFFGHLLCAAPLISYLKDYRYFHFEHHRYAGKKEKDPELKFYLSMGIKTSYESRAEVFKVLVNDFSGTSYIKGLLYVIRFFGKKRKEGVIEKPTLLENLCVFEWSTIAPLIMWKLGLILPYLIFWVLPILL